MFKMRYLYLLFFSLAMRRKTTFLTHHINFVCVCRLDFWDDLSYFSYIENLSADFTDDDNVKKQFFLLILWLETVYFSFGNDAWMLCLTEMKILLFVFLRLSNSFWSLLNQKSDFLSFARFITKNEIQKGI